VVRSDEDAWNAYPLHRKYFNKLWLSQKLGYSCGPAGVAPFKKDTYIVRPIYNLYGMGLGAKEMILGPDDCDSVEPGYFWCEKFDGVHRSIDYGWKNNIETNWSYEQKSCFIGEKDTNNPFLFKRWYRDVSFKFWLPPILNDIPHVSEKYRIPRWNLEIIDNNVIEVHLRGSPDPDYDEIIPVFQGFNVTLPEHRIKDYKFIQSEDDAGGRLNPKRLGFYVRNYL